jgi:heat shock protein HslJ
MTGATPTSSSAQATSDAVPTAVPMDLAQLIGHTYVAIEVTENGQHIAIVPETRIGLRFIDATHFAASGGCDDIGGDYEIRDGRLKTDNLRGFSRLCAGERGEQSSRFQIFLQSSPTMSRKTTGLVLSTAEVVITFVEEATT